MANHRVTLLPSGPYETVYVASGDSIGFAFDAQSGSHAIGSDKAEAFVRIPNSLAAMPRGCDVRSRSRAGGEYLLVTGPLIESLPDGYRTNIRAPFAVAAASHVRRWILSGNQPDVLEAEAMLRVLAEAVSKPERQDKAARWMTPARYKRVVDAVEAGYASAITVSALAREIGVSSSFLTRAFRAYCGQSPYDFILSRRLQAARRMLAETDSSLAAIALECGFSSQSHMSSLMRARLGLSPSSLRDH
ncbi:MAG: helix-turn-helix transcriptional regulator [Roseibium sp.]|nr:helix-turn-helix transcriptional regulator [Roseibium sp.]